MELLELGMPSIEAGASIHADLAQGYAKLGRWPRVVEELEKALALEVSPERGAAFHYFIADALERLIRDPALAEKLAQAGRQHVVDHFDLRTCLEPLLERFRAYLEAT